MSLLNSLWGIRRDMVAYVLAFLDSRMPVPGKIAVIVSVVYILMPFDLVPDVVPFAGILDDMVLSPLLLWYAGSHVPASVMVDARARSDTYNGWINAVLALLVVWCLLWCGLAIYVLYAAVRALIG